MTASKPTVLFIHGSWHNPNHFRRVRDLFETQGFPTSCPSHPSVGHLPPIGLKEDAQCIRDEVKKLVEAEEKYIIVVAHSYGGIVASEALDADFALKARESKGLSGGILHLVFMCAFLVPLGSSLAMALGLEELPPYMPVDEQGMCVMLEPERRFYNDLPKEEQDHWVAELKPCPAITQLMPITYASYLHHPSTYLLCENDQGMPVEVQKMMVHRVCQEGNIVINMESCTAGHSPFLSQPEAVLQVVERILTKKASINGEVRAG